jgi:hypothetical protein
MTLQFRKFLKISACLDTLVELFDFGAEGRASV